MNEYIEPIATASQIIKIATKNPLIQGVWKHWQKGTYRSWEEAMMHAVVLLEEQNEILQKELMEQMELEN